MDEEQKHLDAFELYFNEKQEGKNVNDAVLSVSSQFNVSERTILRWKKNFNWDDREAVRSAEINREVQKNNNSTIIDNKTKYLSYVHAALNKVIKQNPDGSVDIDLDVDKVRDMEILIKLGLLLQGEVTDRTESQNKNHFDNNAQKQILEDEGSNE